MLKSYLNWYVRNYSHNFEERFSFSKWKLLAGVLLVKIHVFNRKRPGEISRMLMEDLNNHTTVEENDPEFLSQYSDHDIEKAKEICEDGNKRKKIECVSSSDY